MLKKILFVSLLIGIVLEGSILFSRIGFGGPVSSNTVEAAVESNPFASQRNSTEANSPIGSNLIQEVTPGQWFLTDPANPWTPLELATVGQIRGQTIQALNQAGLDGRELLEGYRFRRFQGEYVDQVEGQLAIVDHEKEEIVLADAAFERHHGFNIYHELGHVVDHRLERRLSQRFHEVAGSDPAQSGDQWLTADGYWLRYHGRDDAEEATADAFALWVMTSQSGSWKPIFYGTPLTVNYDGIVEAIEIALQG
jgi:hypothetical protein